MKLRSGELRGIRVPEVYDTIPVDVQPRRLFRVKRTGSQEFSWFWSYFDEAELIRNPVVDDQFERYFLFEPGQPARVAQFDDLPRGRSYTLAVPEPEQPVTLNAMSPPPGDEPSALPPEDRAYVVSYVTEWGEETRPSPPRLIRGIDRNGGVRVSGFYSGDTSQIEGRAFKYVRIYRTVTGTSQADYFFVADVDWGETEYEDERPNNEVALEQIFPQFINDQPVSGLTGARVHPNGFLVAFKDQQVYFSRPYLPYAWPQAYALSLQDEVVRLEIIGQSIIVMTKGSPAVIFGNNVAAMAVNYFTSPLPCSNYNAVVPFSTYVYYPSPDGLVAMSPNGPEIVSQPVLGREEWLRDYYSTDIFATRSENDYVALRSDGTGFVFSTSQETLAVETLAGFYPGAVFLRDSYDGQVFLLAQSTIYRWDPERGNEATFRWRSKPFTLARPTNMASVQVELLERDARLFEGTAILQDTMRFVGPIEKGRQVVFRAWADGQLVAELVCSNRTMVNLPAGFEGTIWQFELEGQCRVYSAYIAESGLGQIRG